MRGEIRSFIADLALNMESATTISKGGQFLKYKFDVNPEDFLEQAEKDFEAGGAATLLNSITNAKRAIRCQVDKILFCFGYDAAKMKITKKKELLNKIGIITPRILKRVDSVRNLLEHEYTNPSLQEVEDSLDLAALFIESSNRSISPFGAHFIIAKVGEYIDEPFNLYKNQLSFDFDNEKKHFDVSASKYYFMRPGGQNLRVDKIGTVTFDANDKIYTHIMELAIAIWKEREKRIQEALLNFFQALECT